MRGVLAAFTAVSFLCSLGGCTTPPRRFALVIGVPDYQNIDHIPNAGADASLIADTLRKVGFDVRKVVNPDRDTMFRALYDLANKSTDKSFEYQVGLFYFSGHGMQVQNKDYLLPRDHRPISEDVSDFKDAVMGVDEILAQMQQFKTAILFLDSCRDGNFTPALYVERDGKKRDITPSKGMATTQPTPDQVEILYAAAPNSVASYGEEKNSPFATALVEAISGPPNTSIHSISSSLRKKVIEKTNKAQTPTSTTSVTEDFYFRIAGNHVVD